MDEKLVYNVNVAAQDVLLTPLKQPRDALAPAGVPAPSREPLT